MISTVQTDQFDSILVVWRFCMKEIDHLFSFLIHGLIVIVDIDFFGIFSPCRTFLIVEEHRLHQFSLLKATPIVETHAFESTFPNQTFAFV